MGGYLDNEETRELIEASGILIKLAKLLSHGNPSRKEMMDLVAAAQGHLSAVIPTVTQVRRKFR